MGNGALAIGPKLPRPSSTLPLLPCRPRVSTSPLMKDQETNNNRGLASHRLGPRVDAKRLWSKPLGELSPCGTQRSLAATNVKLAGLSNLSRDVANGGISIILGCPRNSFDDPFVAVRKTCQDGHRLVANVSARVVDQDVDEISYNISYVKCRGSAALA